MKRDFPMKRCGCVLNHSLCVIRAIHFFKMMQCIMGYLYLLAGCSECVVCSVFRMRVRCSVVRCGAVS